MSQDMGLVEAADIVSLFCRLNVNAKRNLPIRSSEMGLLILVCKNDTPVTPVMAADFFKVKKPMIATTVASLMRQGYIIKVPSLEDKRSFILQPTEKAVELVERTYSEYNKALELLKAQLGSKDFSKLIALLDKANTALLEGKSNG